MQTEKGLTTPRASGWRDFGSIVTTSVALGLISGIAEVGVVAWQMNSRGRMGVNPDFMWLSPVSYGVSALVVGVLCASVRGLLPRIVSWNLAVAVPFALCAASVLGLRFTWLTSLALTILSLGIGFQGARLLGSRRVLTARVARWACATLLLGVAATGLFVRARARITEDSRTSALPQAQPGAVSILLLVLDTVGAQHLSLFGYERLTSPELSKWAARGVTFDHALSTAPWTLPSHATMMTGLYPHEFRYGWYSPVRTDSAMLAEAFYARGYLTAAFLGNYGFLPKEYGLARGFIHYQAGQHTPVTVTQGAWLVRQTLRNNFVRRILRTDEDFYRPPAPAINEQFLSWMKRHPADRPFFAFLNYFDAHQPYIPPRDVFQSIAGYKRTDDLDPLSSYTYLNRYKVTREEVRLAKDSHDAAIAAQDRAMGNLLDEMERRGMLRNTVVVIVSDHGEELGEHSFYFHGHTLYSTALHVPLVIAGPGIPAGVRVAAPVTLRDLAATIADLTRLPSPAFPGNSLAWHWRPELGAPASPSPLVAETKRGINLPDRYPTARADAGSIFVDSLHYIEVENGKQHLFNWLSDPKEQRDLLESPATAGAAEALRRRLHEIRGAAGGS